MTSHAIRYGAALSLVVVASTPSFAADRVVRSKPSTSAASHVVRYAPQPTWVIAPPAATEAAMPPGAPARVVFFDQQVRIGTDSEDSFSAYRLKILQPEALAAGNLTVAWSPSSEDMTIHRVVIVRDGRTIDVLATQKFAVIQRENNLEQAMLDGVLTATLQVSGLQVGDDLEVSMTRHSRDANLGGNVQGFMQFPLAGVRGAYRSRVVEPRSRAIAFRASSDVPQPVIAEVATERDRRYAMSDPASAIVPDGAPPRYSITRVVQYSSFADWADVSRLFQPLYQRASTLPAGSPIRAEAMRIAVGNNDPLQRVEAALRVVEDRIRYVYVGLDGGNYVPATADETWQRRFGDCKAKTALLLALLHELGITAEPVLVSSNGGDGIDERLPTPAAFDHVLVRATVGDRRLWLDGTRLGDRKLDDLDAPTTRWALPLRPAGASLEAVAATPPRYPNRIDVVEIDATGGFDKPGKYRVQQTLRGDEIFAIRAQLAGVAAADADRLQSAYWRQQLPDVEPTKTTWRFDDDRRLLILSLEGEGKVDWDGDEKDGHTHYLFGGGFPPPGEMKRPKDQAKDAAWATDFPSFSCYATTVKVPAAGKGFKWDFSSNPVDRTLGGIAYYRISSFRDGVMRIVKSRRVLEREVTAAEAAEVNGAIKGFDNNKSYVFETKGATTSIAAAAAALENESGFGSFDDFAGDRPPCQGRSIIAGGAKAAAR